MMILSMRPLRAALFLFGVFAIASCEKPESDLGLNIQPDEDLLNVVKTDTFSFNAHTAIDDSIRTDELLYIGVGAYNDPVFGKTSAQAFLQMRLTSASIDFTPDEGSLEDIVVDSVIMSLAYRDTLPMYGNGIGAQHFEVFELSERMYLDSTYYASSSFMDMGEDMISDGENEIVPNPNDSVSVGGTMQRPQLRIRLKNTFGEELIQQSGTGNLEADAFLEYFKGFRLSVNENMTDLSSSSLVYFNPYSSMTRVVLYYTNEATGVSDEYDFRIGTNGNAFVNSFSHDYSMADMDLQAQLDGDTSLGQQKLFVQGAAGLRSVVNLPDIREYLDSANLSINKAELVIPYEESDSFNPPYRILAFGIADDGRSYLLPDQGYDDNFFDGNLDEENQEYRINISFFMDQVANGSRELTPIELVPSNTQFFPQRVVLNGQDHPDPSAPEDNLKLVLTLTKY